jgi:hypothetical protein
MPTAGEPHAEVAPRVHVGGAAQVLDPCSVQDHKTVANSHFGKWIALSGVNAAGQGDIFFDVHGHIVQQTHKQRNRRPSRFKFIVSVGLFPTSISFSSSK